MLSVTMTMLFWAFWSCRTASAASCWILPSFRSSKVSRRESYWAWRDWAAEVEDMDIIP